MKNINLKIKIIAETKLSTYFGNFLMVGFEEIISGNNHIALIYEGKIKTTLPIIVRIHSECITGDALFSLKCDCGFQLKESLKYFEKLGNGILLYHRQECRNIGILNKIKAYYLQSNINTNTIEANHQLGFLSDERNFTLCANMLKLLGIKKINLLTNNLDKIKGLTEAGINIIKRIPLIVGKNLKNHCYLNTKKKIGHLFKI